jgi:hypothetical protein
MLNISEVKAGMTLQYLGNWIYFEDTEYEVYPIEETYKEGMCPESEKGKLVIVELTNSDMALFIPIERLKPNEWRIKDDQDR